MFRKSQPNFQRYCKKIEAQGKNSFLIRKTCNNNLGEYIFVRKYTMARKLPISRNEIQKYDFIENIFAI